MTHHTTPACSVLAVVHRYKAIKAMTPEERKAVVPRVCVIGGKAAPGYDIAKRIIKLVRVCGCGCVSRVHKCVFGCEAAPSLAIA